MSIYFSNGEDLPYHESLCNAFKGWSYPLWAALSNYLPHSQFVKAVLPKRSWYDDYLNESTSFLILLQCLLWEDDTSHPITHCDGFIFLDQWLWSLLEQHCTMTLHLKDQTRWLVTCGRVRISCMSELLLTSLCLWQCSWTGRKLNSTSTEKAVWRKQATAELIRAGTQLSQKDFHLTKSTSQSKTKSKILVQLLLDLQIFGAWKYNGNHKLWWRLNTFQCGDACNYSG